MTMWFNVSKRFVLLIRNQMIISLENCFCRRYNHWRKKHQGCNFINSNRILKLTVDLRGTHGPRLLLILPHHVEAPGGVIGGRLLDTGVPARNIVFGFVRSSRSHNVCPSVTLVICCSEHSIFICLAQISKLFAHHSPSLSQLSPKSLSVSLSTLLALS